MFAMDVLRFVSVCLLGLVLLRSSPEGKAELDRMAAPLMSVGNIGVGAADTLVAYELVVAIKALSMIIGDRSFNATIAYDSEAERCEQPHGAADEDHDVDCSDRISAIRAAPNPVTADLLPDVKKHLIWLPTAPPLPNNDASNMVGARLLVSKIVSSDFVTKVAELDRFGRKPIHIEACSMKNDSAFVKGGSPVGHGNDTDGSQCSDVKLGSGEQLVFDPVTPAAGPRVTVPVEDKNATDENTSANVPLHRPTRSVDSELMGRYFKFIEANDEGSCVALMVCSMAADPQEFGAYGRKVVQFFEGVELSASSPVAPYKNAWTIGRNGDSCRSRYPACRGFPKNLANLGEYFSS
ncbi:hypothetical protein V5799_015667 [Amblyomma americanum]|uniref:Secreted protein n=1 Tax=Amblyomma americanum TaxID=6943 RepID=A0AAQ4F8C7_AMBAM